MQRAFKRLGKHVCGGRYQLDFPVTLEQVQKAVDEFCELHPILRGVVDGDAWVDSGKVTVTEGHPSKQKKQKTAWRVSLADNGLWFYFDHTLLDGWANFIAANAVLDHLATGKDFPVYPMNAKYPRMRASEPKPFETGPAGKSGPAISFTLPLRGDYRAVARSMGVRGMEQLAEAAYRAFDGQYPAIISKFIPDVKEGLCQQSMFALYGDVEHRFGQLVDYETMTLGMTAGVAKSTPHLAIAVFPTGHTPYVWVETYHDFHKNQIARVLISSRKTEAGEEHYLNVCINQAFADQAGEIVNRLWYLLEP